MRLSTGRPLHSLTLSLVSPSAQSMAAHRTTLPQRIQAPVFPSQVPIAVAGLLAALLVGVLLAKSVGLGLAVLLGLLYAPVVLLDLSLGVALWIPLVFVERVPGAGRGSSAVSIMVALAWLATLPARRQVVGATLRRHTGLVFMLLLLLVWVSISVIWSVDPTTTIRSFPFWWIAAGVFIIVATSLTERRHVVIVCAAFIVGALISVIAGLIPGTAAPSDVVGTAEANRLVGSYGDPNFLAAGLVPAMALTAGLAAVIRRSRWRAALLACAVVLAGGLVATGSRGGVVAAGVAGVGALLVARGKRLPILVMFATVVLVGGLWVTASSSSNWSRIRDFGTGTGRVDLWTIALRMGNAHPVNGVGLDGFKGASGQFLRRPGRLQSGQLGAQLVLEQPHEAHNTYLQMYAETGLVGVALLAAVLAAALRATWLAARAFERSGDPRFAALARSVLIAQVSVLIALVFISDPFDKRTWILLALGPALLTVASRTKERTSLGAG
jgi:O-antigen ligase